MDQRLVAVGAPFPERPSPGGIRDLEELETWIIAHNTNPEIAAPNALGPGSVPEDRIVSQKRLNVPVVVDVDCTQATGRLTQEHAEIRGAERA